MKYFIAIILLFFITTGCNSHEFDAEYAAKSYCNCLQEERKEGMDFFESRAKCDGELLTKNRFFRLDYIGFTKLNYVLLMQKELRDSVNKFHFNFYDYVEKNCCKQGLLNCDKNDSLQIKVNTKDTLNN